jgi:hypothetical protein
MNIFEAIYNVETAFYLIVMVFILLFTLYLARGIRTEKQLIGFVKVIGIELIFIGLLFYLLTRLGSKTKSVLGIFDLLNMAR